MNHLLIWEWNWDIAYNRLINKELWEIIKDEEISEDFSRVLWEVKDLIDKKEWIANPEELKKKICDTVYRNKNNLPSFEHFYMELREKLSTRHGNMDLNSQWWEKELESNFDVCLNYCLDTKSDVALVKQIIIYEIMRQWFELKKENEEKLDNKKYDTSKKIVHVLDMSED